MSRIKLYESFKHWQDKGNIMIFSDPHFEDKDREVMGYNFTEYNQINFIKKHLHKMDTLVCLGDIGNPAWLKKIPARRKVLIKGNHDAGSSKYKDYFDEIYEGALFISSKIVLSHEPLPVADWYLNIHGHDHSGGQRINHINLAPGAHGMQILNLNDLVNKDSGLKPIEDIHRALAIDPAIKAREGQREREEFDDFWDTLFN